MLGTVSYCTLILPMQQRVAPRAFKQGWNDFAYSLSILAHGRRPRYTPSGIRIMVRTLLRHEESFKILRMLGCFWTVSGLLSAASNSSDGETGTRR